MVVSPEIKFIEVVEIKGQIYIVLIPGQFSAEFQVFKYQENNTLAACGLKYVDTTFDPSNKVSIKSSTAHLSSVFVCREDGVVSILDIEQILDDTCNN